ncbi:MAG: isoprenyl transferase [Proteobacteria bacterium]|nr:isoprenyl transferase [Pseudomonadota bacterium]MBU1640364.1 isoprenyl transferase [Pseudomonadota bacterium]
MDGNGRWAQAQGLIRLMGHKAGVKAVKEIVEAARELAIPVLTLYAFSTENWNRPHDEVSGLMTLLKNYLKSELEAMLKNDIQLRAIGDLQKLPADVYDILSETMERTKGNKALILNLALNYGGRNELVHAIKDIGRKLLSGKVQVDDISEDLVNNHLYTRGLPDPDLLIRTGGEARLSNFLLWQSSYSEIYFTDTPWPEFNKESLKKAIADYQQRQRRFGKTGEQV